MRGTCKTCGKSFDLSQEQKDMIDAGCLSIYDCDSCDDCFEDIQYEQRAHSAFYSQNL